MNNNYTELHSSHFAKYSLHIMQEPEIQAAIDKGLTVNILYDSRNR